MGDYLHRKPKKKNRLAIVLAALLAVVLAVALVLWGLRQQHPLQHSSGTPPTAPTTGKTLPKDFIDRNTAASYIVLSDITNGRILYSKNENQTCYPASLTKLMTAIVALESVPDPTTPFTVGDEVHMIAPDSSRAYLTVGTRLTLEQLLQALLLPSGNDAAYVLAVQVGRVIADNPSLDKQAAIQLFLEKMNDKAKALGCAGTHFANPDGIHRDDHYTTAADILRIATCALQQNTLADIMRQPEVQTTLLSGQTATWKNTNRLLHQDNIYTYADATGMKTGSTDEAGYCLVASATRNGRTAIAVVMGAPTKSGRFEDARGLLDISFQ